MKDKKVIDSKNLPARIPLWPCGISLMAMDMYNAPQWLWGAVGLFWFVVWIAFFVVKSHEQDQDIFKPRS